MKKLDLEKVYNVLCTVIGRQHLLEEEGKHYDLLYNTSNFYPEDDGFENFLSYYSFKFVFKGYGDSIKGLEVFNNDLVPYEDYSLDEHIIIPIQLLSMSPVELEEWIEIRIKECERESEVSKQSEIKSLENEIERKQQQLERLKNERNGRTIN